MRIAFAVLTSLVAFAPLPADAAVQFLTSSATVAAPGESTDICVGLDAGGADVAGTQNDLRWDDRCAAMVSTSDCVVAGSHGKDLSTAPCGDSCVRAIVLSLTDVNPIPNGLLYCCRFTAEAEPGGCCNFNLTNVGAADPNGVALSVNSGVGGRLCVAVHPTIGTPTPTPTPPAPPGAEDDGCQISSATSAGFALPLSLVIAFVLAAVRVRAVRNRSDP